MKTFLFRFISNTLALAITIWILPRDVLYVRDWNAIWQAALVLGLLNAFVRPVLLFLTLPINILTLGLFTIFLNAALFFTVGYIIDDFVLKNYPWAILGSIVFSALSTLLSWMFHERREIKGSFHLWRF